ncbi:MAG: porin family protein [Bacteroidota bacterium]|nr:porin family protein [Bacteroidota bacterium]
MKKIILAFGLFALISSTAFSQISGGLFVGPNLSWFGVDSKIQSNEGVGLGYNFGAMIDLPITDNFVFSSAVQYNAIKSHMHYNYGTITNLYDINTVQTDTVANKITYNLSYIEIPLGFKGKTNEIGFLSYYMKAGVSPMIRLKGLADITSEGDDLFTENIRFFNMNWHMGAGFEWSLSGKTRFITEVVYSGGIIDFIKTNDETTVEVFQEEVETDGGNILTETKEHRGKFKTITLKVGILF